MEILSFLHPHAIPNLYDLLSIVEHRRYFENRNQTVLVPINFYRIGKKEGNWHRKIFCSTEESQSAAFKKAHSVLIFVVLVLGGVVFW